MGQTGVMPGNVYSSDDYTKGNMATVGTQIKTTSPGASKEFVSCLVAASQNLTDGCVVTIDSGNVVTIAAAGSPASNVVSRLGVAVCSITASASTYIWVQIFGPCSVLATLSTLPNVGLTIGATAGRVDDAITSLSAVIEGLHLTATSGTAGALAAAFLNYPRFKGPSGILS